MSILDTIWPLCSDFIELIKKIFKKRQDPLSETISNSNSSQIIHGSHNSVMNISQYHHKEEATAPDLVLEFVYQKCPSLVIANQSSGLARDIKLQFIIWNTSLPERDDPLPIPITPIEWLRGNSKAGPLSIFHASQVACLIKNQDRLFGTVSVLSPDSVRGRTYIVFIEFGVNGWFCEIEDIKSGAVLLPKKFFKEERFDFFANLETYAPQHLRRPIVD